jgi:hypothetical protein
VAASGDGLSLGFKKVVFRCRAVQCAFVFQDTTIPRMAGDVVVVLIYNTLYCSAGLGKLLADLRPKYS